MTTSTVSFTRRFQMWSYTVGHGQLLLRSPKTTNLPIRIDVLFKNVAAIHLPTILDDLVVLEAAGLDKEELSVQCELSRLEGRKVFVVRGSNFTGYVIAGSVAWHEDQGEYDEPSHFSLAPGDSLKC